MSISRVRSALPFVVVLGALSVGVAVGSQLPPDGLPGPGGIQAQLSVPGTGTDQWALDVFRRHVGTRSAARIPGSIDYCLGVSLIRGGGKKRLSGVTCGLSTATALRINRHGLKPDCGGGGVVLGEPAQPQPTCGLVAADVGDVTVSAENGPAATAQLSEPFRVRYNRSKRILRRSGIDPKRLRDLPRTFLARAFLAFVPTPPTPPGGRTPRLTITATRADGGTLTRSFGGGLYPVAPERPLFRADPGAPQARLAVTATDGRRWKSTSWRDPVGVLCATARLVGRETRSTSCHGPRQLMGTLRGGPQAYTGDPGIMRESSYPVYGFVRGQALALTVIDRHGHRWKARLSRVFTTIRRGGRAIRVRAFLAAIPGPPPAPERSLELETKLSTGYTESVGGGLSPGLGDE